MIITIDGPAGSGKSTVARELAARLGIAYLDTGAMYRAIACAALDRAVNLDDKEALVRLARSVLLDVECGRDQTKVRVDGRDVTEAIRSMAVSRATPCVARCQPVRDLLVVRQREIGQALGSFVAEGRDQGSVVFPDADLKFVLEADLSERAKRRAREIQADGGDVEFAEVVDNLRARDAVDSVQWNDLMVPGQAIVVDTSDRTVSEVVDRLVEHVRGAQ
jgi:cytidylate kinase